MQLIFFHRALSPSLHSLRLLILSLAIFLWGAILKSAAFRLLFLVTFKRRVFLAITMKIA